MTPSPFSKHTPSVFVVCSPFQAICAISTIRQLEIDDFKIIAFLQKGEVRNSQIEGVFRYFNIDYISLSPSRFFETNYFRFKPLFKSNNQYCRLFIGDYRRTFLYCLGCSFVSDNSHIVYLDDGNISISLLKGRNAEPISKNAMRLFELYRKRRGFCFFKNFLTIYSDISNPNYNIEGLQLDILTKSSSTSLSIDKNIYIVGTNLDSYCGTLGLAEDRFVCELDNLFCNLRMLYPKDSIIYIPHGRETKEYARAICDKYNAKFLKPSTTIEVELISATSRPEAIYGFTSTALFTLKKLFPDTKVFNVVFDSFNKDNPFVVDILDCSLYYSQNGIEQINI